MNIKYDQLIQSITQGTHVLSPCYCICSDELLLQIELVDHIRAMAKSQGFVERTSLVMTATSDWGVIDQTLNNTSLFAEKKILEIFIPTGKPGTKGAKALLQLVENISKQPLSDIIVIITLPRLDKATQNTKWAKTLLSHSTSTMIYPITREKLPQWIAERVKQQGQSLSSAAIFNLVDKTEGNLLAAHQEIQKLRLTYPEGAIDTDDLNSHVSNASKFNVFNLSDALLSGQTQRSIKIIKQLEAEDEPLMGIIFYLAREFKQLYELASLKSQGQNPYIHLRKYRVFPPKDRLYMDFLNRFSPLWIMGLLQHLHDIECIFKGLPVEGRSNKAWEELIKFSLRVHKS